MRDLHAQIKTQQTTTHRKTQEDAGDAGNAANTATPSFMASCHCGFEN